MQQESRKSQKKRFSEVDGMNKIASWGNLGRFKHHVWELTPQNLNEGVLGQTPGIAYGMGRSYGDACLNPHGALWKTRNLDRFVHFDANKGLLTCEPGVLLAEIQQLFVPQGFMLPVSPGTQQVTVGGAIANDIHGKNHFHAGSFGHHIKQLQLLRTDGERIDCSSSHNEDWFSATIGGVGLTGLIVQAEIQLQAIKSPWFLVEKIPFTCLDDFFQLTRASQNDWEYGVAWVDYTLKGCQGIFMRANPLEEELPLAHAEKTHHLRFKPPFSLINKWTSKGFNTFYFASQKKQRGLQTMHYIPFLYPLDKLQHWNRLYGPKGFYQYQCVISPLYQKEAIEEMLRAVARCNEGVSLPVLKSFGARSSLGMMSFPMEGVSLAMDLPNRGQKTKNLLERLDAIVAQAKGRLYLAKDARMTQSLFETSYPRVKDFQYYRDLGMSSALSRRLMGF